ncbi:uncharacterized protein LOC120909297 [Rana temporaria]|uniref:uncharacterized protein LOC120909297 n=1 Tax=Rana temporaria TaxID=8407 RepID=UPI001AAE0EC7|nr:uncharacterized protein LOC120909297 [Rana temporaria]
MSLSAVTTEDGKVSCKTEEGSVININIAQQSSWDYLNDGVNILRKIWNEAPPTTLMSPTSNEKAAALPVILGASQFPMGIISVALYAIVLVTDLEVFRGAPLWMGIPFILSGPSEVAAYINQGIWVFVSVISQLLIFSVSVVGLVFTGDAQHNRFMYYLKDDIPVCEGVLKNAKTGSYQSYDLSNSYNQHISYYQSDPLKECQHVVNIAKDLSYGLLIMLLIIGFWGVISSTITVMYRLKTEYDSCNPYKGLAEEDNEPREKTPPYTITM